MRNGCCKNSLLRVKVNWSRYRPGVAQRVGRGIALLFHDCVTRRGWVDSCTLPSGKTPYPLYRGLGGPQGQSGWVENLVPTRIGSRTVHAVVSHYTDWAAQPTSLLQIWHTYIQDKTDCSSGAVIVQLVWLVGCGLDRWLSSWG